MKTTLLSPTLRFNLRYLLIAFGIGLLIYVGNSLMQNSWAKFSYLYASLLFSITITLIIANIIYLANTSGLLKWEKVWFAFPVYYLLSLTGMIIGIELTYFILSRTIGWRYAFPHWSDYPFDALIVLLVCTAVYINHYRKALVNDQFQRKDIELKKMELLKKQAELDALQAKVNPHFLYNALNSIIGLIRQNPAEAEQMTFNLASLFRHTLNYQKEDMILLNEELELLDLYLKIEKVRFADRIHFGIEVEENLRGHSIPRFLLQPLVENALKHGIKTTEKDAWLKLRIFKRNAYFHIQVADSGKAFTDNFEVGYGIQSTYDKLDYYYSGKAEVMLLNSPEKMVEIKIPLTP